MKDTNARRARAIVIGAGLGGLAAAIRLQARGYDVTVVDRLPQAGGRARVFKQDGFTFDAGPTVITAPFLFEELWEMAGCTLSDDVEIVPVYPFYRIRFDDGTVFDYSGDEEKMKAEVSRLAPDDLESYMKFIEKSEKIFKVGFSELAHVPFHRIWDMIKIIPQMIRLESQRTVYGLVSKYIKNEKLRQILSFHPLLVGGNPFKVTSIYALILYLERKWGVHYAMGGTGSLVRGMVDLIESKGGKIILGQEVEQILVRRRRAHGVRLKSGDEIASEIVVSNADFAWTYKHLVPSEAKQKWTDQRLDKLKYSMSLFVWYFGTNRQYEDVAHHTILLGPRYEGLLDDIFEKKKLAADFSLYLHRPTATDPSMAPEGCDAFYVLSPVPHLDCGEDWRLVAETYRASIMDYLEESVMPGLKETIVTSRMLTPQHFLDDYLSHKGAAFSVEPRLTQSAYFRPHNKSEDVEHLYICGAGSHPGAGMPGVLSSARVLDAVVPDPEVFEAWHRVG